MPEGMAEAEVRGALTVSFTCDMEYTTMSEWRKEYEQPLRIAVTEFIPIKDGLHRVAVERVERGVLNSNNRAAKLRIVVSPPNVPGQESSLNEKIRFDDGFADGSWADELRKNGIPCSDVSADSIEVHTKTITDIKSRCTRCRSGSEQADNDHREFTRRCSRDGSCKKATEFTVDDACAHGCASHCSTTCKRFHVTKEKVCLRRRRLHEASESIKPNAEVAAGAATVTGLFQVHEGMRQTIAEHVESQNLLSIDDVTAGGGEIEEGGSANGTAALPSEVKVISTCFAECAQSCIEHCIGQWTDAIPRPDRTLDALEKAEKEEAEKEAAEEDAVQLVQQGGHTNGDYMLVSNAGR